MTPLRIAIWNINGLAPNIQELETLINNLDAVLISESHSTPRSSFRIKGFNIYHSPHPDGSAHAGSALAIRSNLRHSQIEPYSTVYLQATSVRLEDRAGPIVLLFSPQFTALQDTKLPQTCLKPTSILLDTGSLQVVTGMPNIHSGDFAVQLLVDAIWNVSCVDDSRLKPIFTGEATYWLSDPKKLPDLLDFFINRGIDGLHTTVESSLDGSSDHTPVIFTINTSELIREITESLTNSRTDWDSLDLPQWKLLIYYSIDQ